MNNKIIEQVVILAGGEGKRLSNVSPLRLPKILTPIGPSPLLEDLLRQITKTSISKVLFLLGYKSNLIIEELDKLKSFFELKIEYVIESEPLGTGGALLNSLKLGMLKKHILLLHGDLLIRMDMENFIDQYSEMAPDLLLLVHPSSHIVDSDIVEINDDRSVKKIHIKPRSDSLLIRNLCNAGIYALKTEVLQGFNKKTTDLDREIIPFLVESGASVFSAKNKGFVRDIGTPERLSEIRQKVSSKNFDGKRPALFIDRDGTINKNFEFITSWQQVEVYKDACSFIRRCNKSGYWVFVITNQSIIARGLATPHDLEQIHAKIDLRLSEFGAFIDDYFYCPHHPDSGFEGELAEFKILCECRKPKPGLIEECVMKYPVDLSKSLVVGDSWRDKELANRLGLKYFIVDRNNRSQTLDVVNSLDEIPLT